MDANQVHQTQDRLVVDHYTPLLAQPQIDASVAIGLSGSQVSFLNQLLQLGICISLIQPFAPGVVGRSRDPEEGTHPTHRIASSVVFVDPISRLASKILRNSV